MHKLKPVWGFITGDHLSGLISHLLDWRCPYDDRGLLVSAAYTTGLFSLGNPICIITIDLFNKEASILLSEATSSTVRRHCLLLFTTAERLHRAILTVQQSMF